MTGAGRSRVIGALLFAALFLAFLGLRLVPLRAGAAPLGPGPDAGLALALAWVLRRPDQLPAPLIAVLGLVEDVLLWRPPGLGAAVLLAGTEAARRRAAHWREHPFLVEWLRVALLIGAMMLGARLLTLLLWIPRHALGPHLLQALATTATYPLAALAVRALAGPSARPEAAEAGMRRR